MVAFENFFISSHARENMKKRAIDEVIISLILRNHDVVIPVREGRIILQKILPDFK
jgi:hypothetical protein